MVPGIPGYQETQELIKDCTGPPAISCPALSIKSTGPMPEDIEIQTMLSEAINRIGSSSTTTRASRSGSPGRS